MNTNNWNKTIDKSIPYIDWSSVPLKHRSDWNSGRHSNIAIELHAILEGSAMVELEDRVIRLNAGQALVIFPNSFHACKAITEPFLRFTVSFVLQDPSAFYERAKSGANHLLIGFDKEFEALCRKIFREYDDENAYFRDEMLSAQVTEMMILLLRNIKPEGRKQETPKGKPESLQIIDHYFSSFNTQNGHTRKGLSQLMNCSERQLNRILKELCGMSFLEKRLRSRMDYARFLLRNTDLKIPAISEMVGYSNEASFYKAFKANAGVTPQEFREEQGKKSENNP